MEFWHPRQRTLTTDTTLSQCKYLQQNSIGLTHAALNVITPFPLSPSLHSSPFRTFPQPVHISLFTQLFQAYHPPLSHFFVHTPTYKFARTFRTSLSHFCSQQTSDYRFSLFQCRYISRRRFAILSFCQTINIFTIFVPTGSFQRGATYIGPTWKPQRTRANHSRHIFEIVSQHETSQLFWKSVRSHRRRGRLGGRTRQHLEIPLYRR